MVTQFIFICPNCGASERISADFDFGFGRVIQPMDCARCHGLIDILFGKDGEVKLTGDPEYDNYLFICSLCIGINLLPRPKNHPCPRCGTEMKNKTDRAIFFFS